MAHVIAPERASRTAGPGLSYWLGTKVINQPLAMEAGLAARLVAAIKDKAFDAEASVNIGLPGASKFAGKRAGDSAYHVTDDGIAVVHVSGVLIDRGEWLGDLGGWATSYEGLNEQFRRIAKDDTIKAVVLDIDSGGGVTLGMFDCCAQLAELRAKKRVSAVAANFACSAAYALACVADEVFVSRTGVAGSIGVVSTHMSMAGMMDQMGVEVSFIHAGAHKVNGNPYQALSHLARAEMSDQVDQIYERFVVHVARERGIGEDVVRATEARVYLGDKAVSAKLADGVKSFEEVLAHVRSSRSRGGAPRGARKATSASASTSTTTGEPGMPGMEPSGGRPDYEAMIAAALTTLAAANTQTAAPAAHTAPAPAAAAATPPTAPVTPAVGATAADARTRVKAILNCEAAKTRPGLAQHLALETDLDAATAEAVLGASAAEAQPASGLGDALAARMAADPSNAARVKPEAGGGQKQSFAAFCEATAKKRS